MSKCIEDENEIGQLINDLFAKSKLTHTVVEAEVTVFRTQNLAYPTANVFNAPSGAEKLGRYNDPLCVKKVWYGAELPTGALAETYGRIKPQTGIGLGMVLNHSDLKSRSMCEVKVLRPLKLLDINLVLSKLGLTLDVITGSNYAITQEIVRVVSRLPGKPFDGIAYASRHHPDGSKCYALWMDAGDTPPLSEGNIVALDKYVYSGVLPGQTSQNLDAEEMLTQVLGYDVI